MKTKLSVDVKVGETLTVGDTDLTLVQKSGQLARLVVSAHKETQIITPKQKKQARMSGLQQTNEVAQSWQTHCTTPQGSAS